MALTPGSRLGPYELVALVGSGGMGEVYRARDPRLGRDVAIKVLPAAGNANPERVRRFEQEARAAAALNHPNILVVYDIGSHDGSPYIVSELLDGDTLRTRLTTSSARDPDIPGKRDSDGTVAGIAGARGLTVRKAVDYAIHMARGLAAAHDKGIVHRDLKPENVFVTSDGDVKILDFGLAKLTEVAPALAGISQLPTNAPDTQPGTLLGTMGYMAPEQVRGQTVDHRADIFAFGAILHEMLSGQRAFAGVTAADTISAILEKDPPEWPLAEGKFSPALMGIVNRCLEKNVAARFHSTHDLAFALEALSAGSSATAEVPAIPRRPSRDRLAWSLVAVLAVLLVAGLVAAAAWAPHRPPVERVVTQLDVVTPHTANPLSFALSPDGRQLAFVGGIEDGQRLWVRAFDHPEARALVGTEDASNPFWSPDGRTVGFFAAGQVKRINVGGGGPQVLGEAGGLGGTWNGDGVILFAGKGGLMRVPATGGVLTPVTRGDGLNRHWWPQFLPDGHHFLFLGTAGRPETDGTYVGSLDGGPPTRVLPDATAAVYAPPDHLLVVRQGVLTALPFDPARAVVSDEPVAVGRDVGTESTIRRSAVSVGSNAVLAYHAGTVTRRRQLVWTDRAGRALGTAIGPNEHVLASPALAPDGQRVAITWLAQGNPDIWLVDLARGVPSRLTFSPSADNSPIWSPDSRRVVFVSSRNGGEDLFEKLASGAGDEHPLLVTPEAKVPNDWSPDGRTIIYTSVNPNTGSDLWALPLGGDRKPFLVLQTAFDEKAAQFSPDGRWLAYESNESGRAEIYIRPFPGPGGTWQVSTGGGTQPRWHPDGKELFYISPDGHLMAAPVAIAADEQAVKVTAAVVLFAARLASGGNIRTDYSERPQYVVARDGRFLMNAAVESETTPPITIVLNWDLLVKR